MKEGSVSYYHPQLGSTYADGSVSLERVVPASRVQAGSWIAPNEHAGCPCRVVATAVTATTVSARCGAETKQWKLSDVTLPVAEEFTQPARAAAIDVGAFLVVAALAILGIVRRKAAASREAAARRALEAASTPGDEVDEHAGHRLELLTCAACGAPVGLVAAAEVACLRCSAPVAIPPAYVELARARDVVVEKTRIEASALRATERVTHPLAAAATAAAAGALLVVLRRLVTGALAAEAHSLSSDLGMLYLVALVLPLGLFIAALGQLSTSGQLRPVRETFEARGATDGRGFECRSCSAPLREVREGAADVCAYCGAQNLIPDQMKRSARKERSAARALGANAELARAVASSSLWRGLSIPLFLLGVLGGLVLFAVGGAQVLMAIQNR